MYYFIVFLFGLTVGSFVNVLIDRLPKGEDVISGRSRCDHCGKTLRWYELIPVFSFVAQRGACLRCHKKLSYQYPLVELITAMGFVGLYSSFFQSLSLLISSIIIFISLSVLFIADLKYQILPDSMVMLGIVGSGLFTFFSSGFAIWSFFPMLYAAIGTSLFFLSLFLITRGRGIGFGDVKLGFLLGLIVGYPKIVIALYVAFLTGAILGVILILGKKKSLKSAVAFGPFLIVGTVAAQLWGDLVLTWWRGLI